MITADYPRELETDVVLRDGPTVGVRPVRPSDVAVRITPLQDGDAHAMVRSLATFLLLDGSRGAPKADVAALEDLLVRTNALVEAHPETAELECDPVVVTQSGAGVIDVRARVQALASAPPSPSVFG